MGAFDELLADPPPAKIYQPGTWGPNAIHQLIAPNAWRLPFERAWREAKNNNFSTRCRPSRNVVPGSGFGSPRH